MQDLIDFQFENQNDPDKNPYLKLEWVEIKGAEYHRYQWGTEPEVIHIIKTGFEDRYMVLWEDAFELRIGDVEHLNKSQIEERFKIKL